MAAPPDLRVLCRRLASTPVDDLPRICPLLISHVLRCGGPLSAPQDARAKDKSSETPVLVHRLRTHISTLLNGKSPAGRFAAVCLIKAVVDVGGWESLRLSDSWLRGLIGLLQKPDPLASKELCIVTLTKIYVLLQGYPTLTREMATPTLPDYVKACLQLIKPPASGRPLKVPATFVDVVASSLSKLVVLYPTTLRPLATQMKAALRAYIAPTSSDALVVPQSLRVSARRVFVLLSYTAPKNGSSEEWAKAIQSAIQQSHATVDQIYRAAIESWESTTGYQGEAVRDDTDPSGGGDSAEELPSWTGVQAGSERLIGMLEFLAAFFDNPTKAPVNIPLGQLLDLTARITLVTPPSTGAEDSMNTNPAIGRDEKAELWCVLADVHVTVLRLHQAVIRRLRESALPFTTDVLDQTVRVFNASRHVPHMRETAYALTKELLVLSGPTLPKLTVDSLAPLIQHTCQDVLLAAGHVDHNNLQPTQPTTTTTTTATTKQQQNQKPVSTNADAYSVSPSQHPQPPHSPSHSPSPTAATTLLPYLYIHLPQPHLPPDLRATLDRAAVLAHHRDALLASCLHPYRDARGRYYASVMPFLARQFPRDAEVEVLRCNLVRGQVQIVGYGEGGGYGDGERVGGGERGVYRGVSLGGGGLSTVGLGKGGEGLRGGEYEVVERGGNNGSGGDVEGKDGEDGEGDGEKAAKSAGFGWGPEMDVDAPAAAPVDESPFATVVATSHTELAEPAQPASPLKRKSEQFERDTDNPPKRVDTGKAAATVVVTKEAPALVAAEGDGSGEDSDSDSDGSVQLDMDAEEEEEEEDE